MYNAMLKTVVRSEGRQLRLPAPKNTGADAVNHKATMGIQLAQLMHRSWTLAKREPRLSRAKILQSVVVAILMMGAFWQVNDYDSSTSV